MVAKGLSQIRQGEVGHQTYHVKIMLPKCESTGGRWVIHWRPVRLAGSSYVQVGSI